jgi:cytidylate kinase
MKTSLEVIQSIINSGSYTHPKSHCNEDGCPPQKALITISRDYGANGTEIARMLAKAFGVTCYDRELLKAIVKETKTDRFLLEQLDEKVTGIMDEAMQALFTKKSTSKEMFFRYMVKVILGICNTGGIIVGRGAHLLIPESRRVLRVRVEGSLEMCAKRVAEQLDIKLAKAYQLVDKTNRERAEFVRKIYERYPTKKTYYDLVVNADLFSPEQASRIIIAAAGEVGFAVPHQ